MVTLTSATNALKSVYLGVVSEQLNVNANPLLSKIKQTSKDVYGKEIVKLAPYGINGGIGAGSETGEGRPGDRRMNRVVRRGVPHTAQRGLLFRQNGIIRHGSCLFVSGCCYQPVNKVVPRNFRP